MNEALSDAIRAMKRIGNNDTWILLMRLIAIAAFLFAASVAIKYINQPLVDVHAFRQTQTALTSLWMIKDGWDFAYQTPVVGHPWSIPFEFPIYQSIVAFISAVSGFELAATGRAVSFLFLALFVLPAIAISRRLDLPESTVLVFCALMFTSPYMVYWSRTFMIESAAFFFSFASIPFAIDIIKRKARWKSIIFYLLLASAGILQKSTTGGPVQLFMLLACLIYIIRQYGVNYHAMLHTIKPAVIICTPVLIGLAWAHYADIVKEANPYGAQLTSKSLSLWNFGTMSQRFSCETWGRLLWERSLKPNAGGYIGLILLLSPWYFPRAYRHYAWLVLSALLMFLLPMIIFTNVHYVHEYYQVASIPYGIAALSIIIGGWIPKSTGVYALVPVITGLIMFSNFTSFNSAYGIVAARSLDESDPRSVKAYKIGQYLREHTSSDQGLVIFGQGYSSEVAYQAQRKSMTADVRFREYKEVWQNPQKYIGSLELGAIVVCPSGTGFPGELEINERINSTTRWKLIKIEDCSILLSDS